MRYCLALKGISYVDNYVTANTNSKGVPYEIDFTPCWVFMKENIIKPLNEEGHEVDVIFNTYHSIKTDEFIQMCKPVSVQLRQYNPNIRSGNYSYINYTVYESLLHIKKYQDENNVTYDYIISGRFDYFPCEKITNLKIIEDGMSLYTHRADMTMIFTQNVLLKFIHLLTVYPRIMVHDYFDVLRLQYNVNIHLMYIPGVKQPKNYLNPEDNPEPNNNYSFGPGIVCHRNVFIKNKNHWFKTGDMGRVLDFEGMNDPVEWYKLLEGNLAYYIKTKEYTLPP